MRRRAKVPPPRQEIPPSTPRLCHLGRVQPTTWGLSGRLAQRQAQDWHPGGRRQRQGQGRPVPPSEIVMIQRTHRLPSWAIRSSDAIATAETTYAPTRCVVSCMSSFTGSCNIRDSVDDPLHGDRACPTRLTTGPASHNLWHQRKQQQGRGPDRRRNVHPTPLSQQPRWRSAAVSQRPVDHRGPICQGRCTC